ncbi:hypothetical protein [Nonomuraea longicatena]|uniref:Uncharacterized protein n=1 Tax=Nonomuraea longicatena TaxID=83682 RepID=A0ABP3Z520_9ACTN
MAQHKASLMPWQHGSIEALRHNPDTHRFIHLLRLAWDLCDLGVMVTVEMPVGREMFIRLPTLSAAGSKIVRAMVHSGEWWFSWSHCPADWVKALNPQAPMIVLEGLGR